MTFPYEVIQDGKDRLKPKHLAMIHPA